MAFLCATTVPIKVDKQKEPLKFHDQHTNSVLVNPVIMNISLLAKFTYSPVNY